MEIVRVRLINSLGKTKGCELAPSKILKELKNLGSTEDGKIIEFSKLELEEIHLDLSNVEEANDLIYKNSKEIFEENSKVFFIGGDHSISYGIGKAFNEVEKNPLLIVFDAHADCMKNESKGKEPTHEEWLGELIEEGFKGENVMLIGARNIWREELEFIKNSGITWIKMDVLKEELREVCDLMMERARNSSGFYISLDVDFIDPGFAPAVAYPEPGGLSSQETIYLVKRLSLLDNFRGADIVEINPEKDINEITVKLGAKILAEML